VQVTLHTDAGHRIAALAVDGTGHAFVAGIHSGFIGRFYVYDISNPGDPLLVGSRDFTKMFTDDNYGMALSPGRAYLAAGGGGLYTFDVTNPTMPRLLSSLVITNMAHDVQYANGLCYVGGGEGLVIVDAGPPASPSRVGRATDMSIAKLAINDHYVYAVGDSSGPLFAIYDVADPYSPKRVFETAPGVPLRGVTVSGTNVFLSAGTNGVMIYDITDPTNAVPVTTIPILGTATDVAVDGNLAFSAQLEGGVLIYDVATPPQPKLTGRLPYGFAPGLPQAIAIANNYAYLPDGYNGIRILDIHDQTQPTNVAIYPTRQHVGPAVTDGSKLYVGNVLGFEILDLANPTNLTELGSYTFAEGAALPYSLAISGTTLFTDTGAFDVSDPANPQPIGTLYAAAGGVIDVEGNYLYYTGRNHVTQVDISDLSAPVITGAAAPLTPRDLDAQNGFLYVAQLNSFTTYDGRSGTNLVQTNTQSMPGSAQSIAVEGNVIAVGESAGLVLENASVPGAPVPVATNNIGSTLDVAVRGGVIYAISVASSGAPAPFRIIQPNLGLAERPLMSVTFEPPNVVLRWPAAYPGMKLYSTTALDGSPWNLVIASPPQDANGYSFTNTQPSNAMLFYKLSNQ
jgi:hypothetical protein